MTTKPERLFTQMFCLKHVFYLMEANEGNFLDFCAMLEALVVKGGVHLPKEYLQ